MSNAVRRLENIKGTYAALASGFDFPRREFWTAVEGRALRDLVVADDEQGDGEAEFASVFPILSIDDREREYIDLFELGRLHPYEGTLVPSAGRDGVLEELLRFYHFFDLKLHGHNRDHPDHIVTELEFMSYLAGLEASAVAQGRDLVSLQRAQRDFLARHVLQWSERLRQSIDAADYASYALLACWLHNFAEWHKSQLDELLDHEIGEQDAQRGVECLAGGQ